MLKFVLIFLLSGSAWAVSLDSGKEAFEKNCASCHGADNHYPDAPVLYGQEPRYIIHALKQFRSGERVDHIMSSMNQEAFKISEEESRSVAAYLGSQDICDVKNEVSVDKPGFIDTFKAGRALAKERNCAHCHGSFHHKAPRLHGQNKMYLELSLRAFQKDLRKEHHMNRIAKSLSDEEIEKLTTYFNGMILMRDCGPIH
jgi:cytochrome c553